ncbi:MAG: LysM peptidoglycan-binding domain-containing protein [Ekhidna sp.]
MRSLLIIVLCSFLSIGNLTFAQEVPKELMIGNVKLHINESARKQIQKDVDRLTRSSTYYNILVDRMNLYFPFIEREHKKAGIPNEIKFLSIQESALISDAVSSANAVGFWQFKDFTGREVGLRVDRKVDERLNIVSASKGSGKYFNSNNFQFDLWPYAVIAYQAGATGAKAHTNKANHGAKELNITPKSYWYLKKFIAHVVAFSPAVGRPHSENIYLDEITNAGGKTLAQIARQQKVDLEELKKYNKWLKSGTVPTDKTYSVFIPKEGKAPRRNSPKEEKEKERKEEPPLTRITEPIAKVYPSELTPGLTNADKPTIITLNSIPSILAKEYDDVFTLSTRATLSESKFRKYNDLGEKDQLVTGEFYYIKKKKGKSKIGYHITQYGESLWSVSQQYGIKLSKLVKKNRMSIIDELKPGRLLWLKKTRPSSTEIVYHKISDPVITKPVVKTVVQPKREIKKEPIKEEIILEETIEEEEEVAPIVVPIVDSSAEFKKVKIHTVASGESLWSIAKKYDLKMDDLLRWNELENPDQISIGQNIQVKAPIAEASAGKQFGSHVVQPGETMYALSRKYGMTVDELMDLNDMTTPDLSVGDTLKVFEN